MPSAFLLTTKRVNGVQMGFRAGDGLIHEASVVIGPALFGAMSHSQAGFADLPARELHSGGFAGPRFGRDRGSHHQSRTG